MVPGLPRLRIHLALALISGAVIAFQLALMQLLSLVQWHHFASMIIAVALLGFGSAGACLSLLRPRLMRRFETLLPLVLCLSGGAMALVTGIAQGPWVRFDSLLMFTGLRPLLKLFLTYGLYLFPIFLAALAIGMIFVRAAADIGRLYFWNLAGSGAGGAAMIGLMWLFPPPVLPGLAALMALAGALFVLPEGLCGPAFAPNRVGRPDCSPPPAGDAAGQPFSDSSPHPGKGWQRALVAAALLSGLAAALAVIRPPVPVLSEFKGLSRALHLPGARITSERTSPYGLMQIFSSPALRYAPGLSLTYLEKIPVGKAVFNNGDWFGAVVPRQGGAFLDYTTGALPYALERRHSVLILDAGSCSLVPQALGQGASRITAVEPHPVILSLLGAADQKKDSRAGPLYPDRPDHSSLCALSDAAPARHHHPDAGRAGYARPSAHRPCGPSHGHALSLGHPPPDGNGRVGDPLGLGDQRLPLRGRHAPGHGRRRGEGIFLGDDPCGPRLRHHLFRRGGGTAQAGCLQEIVRVIGIFTLDNRTMVLYAEAMKKKCTARRLGG